MGVYLQQDPKKIHATLEWLKRLQAISRHDSTAGRDYQRKLRSYIDIAINRKAGDVQRGRKDSPSYEIECRRDQRAIYDRIMRRVCVYQFGTAEARKRFSHLLSDRNDF